MKAATLAFAALALTLAAPVISRTQNYGSGPSITIPFGGNRNEQQAQGRDRDHDRYCDDLRHRAADAREDANRARDRDDFARAQDQLHDVRDRLARDCGGD